MNTQFQNSKELKSMMLLCFATYVSLHGFAPSEGELSQMTGIRPGRIIGKYLRDLKAEGLIRDDYRTHLRAV